jgi:hypothetical protein
MELLLAQPDVNFSEPPELSFAANLRFITKTEKRFNLNYG